MKKGAECPSVSTKLINSIESMEQELAKYWPFYLESCQYSQLLYLHEHVWNGNAKIKRHATAQQLRTNFASNELQFKIQSSPRPKQSNIGTMAENWLRNRMMWWLRIIIEFSCHSENSTFGIIVMCNINSFAGYHECIHAVYVTFLFVSVFVPAPICFHALPFSQSHNTNTLARNCIEMHEYCFIQS